MNASRLRERARFVLALLFAVWCSASSASAGLGRPPSETTPFEREIAQLRNTDLRWESFGSSVQPICRKPEFLSLAYTASPAIDYLLLKSLQDPERFQIAHVLLTLRGRRSWPSSTDAWNGLPLQTSGHSADPVMAALYERWMVELEARRQSLRMDASLAR